MLVTSNREPLPYILTVAGTSRSGDAWLRQHDPETQNGALWWAEQGYRKLVREEGDAPLGYGPMMADEQDGIPIWRQERKGTEAERAEAALQQYREGLVCSAVQGVKALEAQGKGHLWDEWRNSEDRERRAFAAYRAEWRRLHPQIIAAGIEHGFSDEELDQLFEYARGLPE